MLIIIVTFVLNILIIMKLIEFTEHFSNEESCEQYLKEVREKQGVVCTKCGGKAHYWNKASKSWICKHCHHQTTLTSGTVMHGSNLPLRYWFIAIHLLTATKKTISAKEMQRQLGHKRYQPIWEMMHKLRSIMGQRDEKYKLTGEFELDEGYFSVNSNLSEDEKLKRGIGSQNKAKVLVMVESQDVEIEKQKKNKPPKKCGHIKMKVIENLKSNTFEQETQKSVEKQSTATMDNLPGHNGVEKVVQNSKKQTVPGKDAPKVLPWVHIAISNAKALFQDFYHGMKDAFLQFYLNEFCYKFNRMYFGDKIFDRLMIAAVEYKPTFVHKIYNKKLRLC